MPEFTYTKHASTLGEALEWSSSLAECVGATHHVRSQSGTTVLGRQFEVTLLWYGKPGRA